MSPLGLLFFNSSSSTDPGAGFVEDKPGLYKHSRQNHQRDSRIIFILIILLSLAIGASGYYIYHRYQAAYRSEIENRLESVAELKISQLMDWRRERVSDATGMYLNNIVKSRIVDRLKGDKSRDLEQEIQILLNNFGHKPGYKNHYLVTKDAMVDMSSDPKGTRLPVFVKEYILKEAAEMVPGQVYISDFHRPEQNGPIEMDAVTPVLDVQNGKKTLLGYIVMEINPDESLFPIIQKWPTPARTAETLLVRREGDEVVYLNELKQRKGTALTLRYPLSDPDLPAAKAVRGETGFVEGKDYRGTAVVAMIKRVPDSPWYMVSKIDCREIYAPLRKAGRIIALITSLILVSFGGAVMSSWMKWQAREYRYQASLETQKANLAVRLETLMQNANDAIILSGQDKRIVEVNKRATEMYGYTREQFTDMSLRSLRSPEAREDFNHERSMVEEGRLAIFETTHMRRDGSCFPVEISSNVMEIHGERYIQSIIRDITVRKKNEEEIRRFTTELEEIVSERTAKLENVNKELESFSYSVSHDLRAPLRAIEGFTRILEEDYAGILDDEGKRIISVIIENTVRMSRLIEDLLAFSRVSRYEPKHEPVDMEALARSVFNEIVPKPDHRIHFTAHHMPTAYADATLIRQVWANLLSNAVKFSSKNDTPAIEVGGEVLDRDIVYYVKDNGVGFDMAYEDKLFGVFQRLHGMKEFEGSGIGLAIVRRIILRHGGTVRAESSVGKGATFYFTIPVYHPGETVR